MPAIPEGQNGSISFPLLFGNGEGGKGGKGFSILIPSEFDIYFLSLYFGGGNVKTIGDTHFNI